MSLMVMCAFPFMNSKRHKPMLQTEGGFRARVLFVRCGLPLPLPVRVRVRTPPL